MEDSSAPHRIAVAVHPPVFAESLVRVLQRPDLELVVDTAAGGYDGLLVSGAGDDVSASPSAGDPDALSAPVVIHLPEPRNGGIGAVVTPEGRRDVPLHTLEAVRGLLEELWPRDEG